MMRRAFLQTILLSLAATATAAAGTVTGVVRNGTSGAPAAGVDVVLIQLRGGMETVANTKTDAQGRYMLSHASLGQEPMLLRVVYRGVNFHQSLPPGRGTADVEVFEPTTNAKAIQVTSRVIVVQPNGPVLIVGEEYTVANNSAPPAAYYKADGTFEFQVPEGGEMAQVSAWGASGMPVVQGTIDRGARRYAIAFAFRPGESGVRISYHVPYGSNQATLRVPSPFAVGRVLVIAPPTMQINGAGLQSAGTEQGWNVYAHEAVAAGAPLEIGVSGTAPAPSAGGEGQPESSGRDAGVPVQALPSRLDSLKWVLVGGFAAIFFLGALYLWRRPAPVPGAPVPATDGKRKRTPEAKRPEATQAVAEVEREVGRSLDELKDTLFRLELRRQAGTISEEDYLHERGRTEQILRELVRG